MINLTENATKELEAFFEDKPKTPVRVYLAPGGCRGPRLALALDEPMDDDTVIEQSGFKFCVNTALLEQIGGVNIDLSYMGFVLEPTTPLPATGGSACGSCGSGGSCGI